MASALDLVAGVGSASFDPLGDFYEGRKTGNAMRELQRADQARPLIGAALQGNSNALRSLAGIDPDSYIAVQKHQAEQTAAQNKAKADQIDRISGIINWADTPEKWDQALAHFDRAGIKIAPNERGFDSRGMHLAEGQTLKEQLSGGYTLGEGDIRYDASGKQIAAGPPKTTKPEAGFTLGEGQVRYDANGNEIAAGPPKTLKETPAPAGWRWGQNDKDGNPTLVGIEGGPASPIDMEDPSTQDYIKLIAANKAKPPSAGRNPTQRRQVIEAVLKVNPQWDETKMEARQKQGNSLAAGPLGNTVRSLGVGVAHLDILQGLGDALQNGDVQAINAAKQEWARQFGGAAPVSFDAAKAIVADEVAKGVIGGQNAQSDRETLAAAIKASSSPEQLRGVITTFEQLMGGQLAGVRQQYNSQNPGANDFDERFLSPETQRILEQFSGSGGSSDPALEDALSKYQ